MMVRLIKLKSGRCRSDWLSSVAAFCVCLRVCALPHDPSAASPAAVLLALQQQENVNRKREEEEKKGKKAVRERIKQVTGRGLT